MSQHVPPIITPPPSLWDIAVENWWLVAIVTVALVLAYPRKP
jgi:hypothetical protein